MSGDVSTRVNRILEKVFGSCADDPKTAVHRAWGISLIFVLVYFALSVLEMINLNAMGGSRALVIAAVWTGIVHLILAVLGTFILKRFPTSFSIGFLLGILLVVANQNLILFGTFQGYSYGVPATNRAFGILGFALFLMLTFFAALLFHFKNHIVVAPIDVKGGVGGFGPRANNGNSGSGANRDNPADETSSSYRQHNADGEDYEASDA